jgi:hypothetical protein
MRRSVAPLVFSIGLIWSGCSFAFVSGPPQNAAQLPYINCTDSRLVPVLDTAFTALMVLNVITLGASTDAKWAQQVGCMAGDPSCPSLSRHGAMILDGVLGAAGAAGMAYGYSRTAQCRQAKAEQAARQLPTGPMPGTWPPPNGAPGTWPPPPGGTPGTWPPPPAPAPPGPRTDAARTATGPRTNAARTGTARSRAVSARGSVGVADDH